MIHVLWVIHSASMRGRDVYSIRFSTANTGIANRNATGVQSTQEQHKDVQSPGNGMAYRGPSESLHAKTRPS